MLYFLVIKNILLLSLAVCVQTYGKKESYKRFKSKQQYIYTNYNNVMRFLQPCQLQAHYNTSLDTNNENISTASDVAITCSYDCMPFVEQTSYENPMLYNDFKYIDPLLSLIHLRALGFYQNNVFALGVCLGLYDYCTVYHLSMLDKQKSAVTGIIAGYKKYITVQLNVFHTLYNKLYISRVQYLEVNAKVTDYLYCFGRVTAHTFSKKLFGVDNADMKGFVGIKTFIPFYNNLFIMLQITAEVMFDFRFYVPFLKLANNSELFTNLQLDFSIGTKHPLDHVSLISRSILNNVDIIKYQRNIHDKVKLFEEEVKKQNNLFKEFVKHNIKTTLDLTANTSLSFSQAKSTLKKLNLGLHPDSINNNNNFNGIAAKIYTKNAHNLLIPSHGFDEIYKENDSKYKTLSEIMQISEAFQIDFAAHNNQHPNAHQLAIIQQLSTVQHMSLADIKGIKDELYAIILNKLSTITDREKANKILQKALASENNVAVIENLVPLSKLDENDQTLLKLLFTACHKLTHTKDKTDDAKCDVIIEHLLTAQQFDLAKNIFQHILDQCTDDNIKTSLEMTFTYMQQLAKASDFSTGYLNLTQFFAINGKNANIATLLTAIRNQHKTFIDDLHKRFIEEMQKLNDNKHDTLNLREIYAECDITVSVDESDASQRNTSNRRRAETETTTTATPMGLAAPTDTSETTATTNETDTTTAVYFKKAGALMLKIVNYILFELLFDSKDE